MEWVVIQTGESQNVFVQLQDKINRVLKQGWTIKDIKTEACASNGYGNTFLVIAILEKKEVRIED